MSTTSTGIDHWKLGDIALARVCKKVYAKVQVVKNEDGLFHDEKGITADENGVVVTKQLCYYVETIRSKHQLWLPYTSLHLAERCRPFYGSNINTPVTSPVKISKKRKLKEYHVLPLNVKPSKYKEPDLKESVEIIQRPCLENGFQEFVRLGKEHVFDNFYSILSFEKEKNSEILNYLQNVDASTEDKFENVIKNIVTEKEIENYLHQCWRYNFVQKQIESNIEESENENESIESSPLLQLQNMKTPVTIHAPWCLVCGNLDKLWECTNCPASFHLACRKEWLVNIIHRKNPPKKVIKSVTLVSKILSSTRAITSVQKENENVELCPSCMWGPKVGYDDVVWHKLGTCSWWPARVLTPGAVPSCLLTRNHSNNQFPLKYYGTLNYSWGDLSRICLFFPKHTAALQAKDDTLRQAMLDACDDYITVYLT